MDQLMHSNEELKRMIADMISKGLAAAGGASQGGSGAYDWSAFQRFRPPSANVDYDGNVSHGHSYKFEQKLDVFDKNGRIGLPEVNKYDVAHLQLQIIESLELLRKKDENMSANQNEIEVLFKRVRDYLLVQD